jgi:CheY-like chemotaxis protein
MGKRVLIVEDSDEQRSALLCAVPRAHVLTYASSGDEAQALIADASERLTPYDLVVIDIDLPGVSGLEVISLLRQLEEPRKLAGSGGRTKVLILSDSPDGQMIYSADALACDGFMVKPLDEDKLKREVERLCPLD